MSMRAAALTLALSACTEREPLAPSPVNEARRSSLAVASGAKMTPTSRELLTRGLPLIEGLATALADETVRRHIAASIRKSQYPERKLPLREFLLSPDGAPVWEGMPRGGAQIATARSSLERLPALELYMPVAAHRRAWRGDDNVLVAVQYDEDDDIVAFDVRGRQVLLSPKTPPDIPVFVVVPREFPLAIAGDVYGVAGAGRRDPEVRPTEDCDPAINPICEPPSPPPPPPPVTLDPITGPTGFYARRMTLFNVAEPWARGNPEIELWLLGTKNGTYRTFYPAPGSLGEARFVPGQFLALIACAGRIAPTFPDGKRFDFNSVGTHVRNVLVEQVSNFSQEEVVRGQFGLTLRRRIAQVGAPFTATLIERDDGGECPTPYIDGLSPSFQIGVGLTTYPTFSVRASPSGNTLQDITNFFGITNANDLMESFTWSSWDSFEAIGLSQLRTNQRGYAEVTFANSGVNRFNVPPTVDPAP